MCIVTCIVVISIYKYILVQAVGMFWKQCIYSHEAHNPYFHRYMYAQITPSCLIPLQCLTSQKNTIKDKDKYIACQLATSRYEIYSYAQLLLSLSVNKYKVKISAPFLFFTPGFSVLYNAPPPPKKTHAQHVNWLLTLQ